jgi:hypothetical protein
VGTVETFEPVMFDKAEAFPTYKSADTIPATLRAVRVPTLVMFV